MAVFWVSGPRVKVADVALGDLTVKAKPLWRFWASGPKDKEVDVALGDLTVKAKPFVAVLGVRGFQSGFRPRIVWLGS